MIFRVAVKKTLVFQVDAATADEARALAVLTADGEATPRGRSRVRFFSRALVVETCEMVDSAPVGRVD